MKSATKVLKPPRFRSLRWVDLIQLSLSRKLETLFCFLAIAQLLVTGPIEAAQAPSGSSAATQTPVNPSPTTAPATRDQSQAKSSNDNPANGKASPNQSLNMAHLYLAIAFTITTLLTWLWCWFLRSNLNKNIETVEKLERNPKKNWIGPVTSQHNSQLQNDLRRLKEDLDALKVIVQKNAQCSVPPQRTEFGPSETPKISAVETPKPESPPPLETSERDWIGLAFTWFCRTSKGELSMEEFCKVLRKKLPNAEVRVVVRPSNSYYDYIEEKDVSGEKYWRITGGFASYLLPIVLLGEPIQTLDSFFNSEKMITPDSLESCVPTLLKMDNSQQGVKEKGILTSTQAPGADSIPRWKNYLEYEIREIHIPPPDSPSQPVSPT